VGHDSYPWLAPWAKFCRSSGAVPLVFVARASSPVLRHTTTARMAAPQALVARLYSPRFLRSGEFTSPSANPDGNLVAASLPRHFMTGMAG
jgi:hypothetical protein